MAVFFKSDDKVKVLAADFVPNSDTFEPELVFTAKVRFVTVDDPKERESFAVDYQELFGQMMADALDMASAENALFDNEGE